MILVNNSDKVYEGILRKRAADIQKNIGKIERELNHTKLATRRAETELLGLKKELERVREEIELLESIQDEDKYYSDHAVVELLDRLSEKRDAKKEDIQNDIDELRELRQEIESRSIKRRIDKKIAKKQKKISDLQKKQIKIDKSQRSIIISKTRKNRMKDRMYSRQEGRVEYWENKINDTEALRSVLNPEESIKDTVLDTIYQFRNSLIYPIFLNRQQEILDVMHEKKVHVIGANIMVMAKRTKNHIKNAVDFTKRELDRMIEENQQNQQNNSPISVQNL